MTKDFFFGALAGIALGASLGLIFAPEKGQIEKRRNIAASTHSAGGKTKNRIRRKTRHSYSLKQAI